MQKELFEALLFREDFCEPPYIVHDEKYTKYRKLLTELYRLKAQGLCQFTYDEISKPFSLHCVYISWTSQDDWIDIPPSVLGHLCSLADGLLIDRDFKSWQLSVKIYEEI